MQLYKCTNLILWRMVPQGERQTGQQDVAYSDDGLDCCVIEDRAIDKDTWVYETEGKCFRYYNSFNCPHCGAPYIDYKKYPQNKVFGVSGCVHLGREHYHVR